MASKRVKKFHPIDKRPSKTRDFYGPLPNTNLPQARNVILDAKKIWKG